MQTPCIQRRTARLLCTCCAAGSTLGAGLTQAQGPRNDNLILAADGTAGDAFGWGIAIDEGMIAVSALGDDDGGADGGSVYLFDADSRELLRKLLPADGQTQTKFGDVVAINDGLVAVGATQSSLNGTLSGSVSLFNASTGELITELLADDGEAFDLFGTSVAIGSGVVAVGATGDAVNGLNSGSVYIFDASSGEQLANLVPEDGRASAAFGNSVAIDNDVLLVGAWGHENTDGSTGAAYLFDVNTGEQLNKLQGGDSNALSLFGWAVAIENDTVAVSAMRENGNGFRTGTVYQFEASSGEQVAKLVSGDTLAPNDGFGDTLDIDGGYIAIGTGLAGAAYLFDATTMIQVARVSPGVGSFGRDSLFGSAVAIDDGVLVAGAWLNDANGPQAGSAYVFAVDDVLCPADTNHDGVLDVADFTYWLFARSNQTPECDQNGDGSCTPTDFTAWIANYNAGC